MSARSERGWAWINFKIGVVSFGGGSRSLLFREALVDRREWITAEQFTEAFTLAQVLPGPNIVNLSICLAYQLFGFRAALVGACLLALPGALLAVAAFTFLRLNDARVALAFQGITLGALVLFLALVVALFPGLRADPVRGKARARKFVARVLVATLVALGALSDVPLAVVLVTGAGLGALAEFFL